MALTFIYGGSGSGKSDALYERIIRLARDDHRRRYFIVVPEQFTMQTQKELVRRSDNHVIMNIDVVSFERLSFRVFEEAGRNDLILEDTGKSLILRKIAADKESSLTVLRANMKRMGYIDQVKSIISEFMQYEIRPVKLREMEEQMPAESLLRYKLADIREIYEEFESYLTDRFITAERILDVCGELAEESALLRDSVIAFDGFTGFTPVQTQLMRQLMKVVSDVYLTVTLDRRENPLSRARIEDLFYMSRRMVSSMRRLAEETGMEIGEPLFMDRGGLRFTGHPDLEFLEQNLFRIPSESYRGADGAGSVGITSCADPADELEYAAARIISMVREKNYRFSDFAIVSADAETYAKYAESVFLKYGIPYFLDQKRDLIYHPLTECIRALLQVIDSDFDQESIFRLLKTDLTGIPAEDVNELENYVLARGIRGYKRFHEPFRVALARRRGRKITKEEEEQALIRLQHLNQIRMQLMELLEPFAAVFDHKTAGVTEISAGIYRFLTSIRAEEKLELERDRLEAEGQKEMAGVYGQAWRIFMDLLDKYVELLGTETMTAEEYGLILDAGIGSAKVGVIPQEQDVVLLGDIERTRLEGVRILFFLGVNDGIVPKNADHGGILSQYDREYLKDHLNIELAPSAREQVFIQKFYLYWNLTKPSEGLYLIYARCGGDGKARRPSYLIRTISELFPDLEETIHRPEEFDLPETPEAGIGSYIRGMRLLEEDPEPSADWIALHRWYAGRRDYRDRIRTLFNAHFYVAGMEKLAQETAAALYGGRLYHSVTRLELFSQCAYAHFLQYGLRLQERAEYRLEYSDAGTLYHEIMERFSGKVEAGPGWKALTEEGRQKILEESFAEAELAQKDAVFFSGAYHLYLLGRMKRVMDSSTKAMVRQIGAGNFMPAEFERSFARKYRLGTDGGHPFDLTLTGVIDRTDLFKTEADTFVRVIDYKSGKKTFSLNEFYYGLQQQLVLYLRAAREAALKEGVEIKPGGFFYYHIHEPEIDAEGQTEAELEDDWFASYQMNGLVNEDPDVITNMDRNAGGKSLILPVSYNKDGSLRASSKTAAEKQFDLLTDYEDRQIRRIGEAIMEGAIDRNPYLLGSDFGCKYCNFRTVCGFEPRIAGCKYRQLERHTDAEIWSLLDGKDDEE